MSWKSTIAVGGLALATGACNGDNTVDATKPPADTTPPGLSLTVSVSGNPDVVANVRQPGTAEQVSRTTLPLGTQFNVTFQGNDSESGIKDAVINFTRQVCVTGTTPVVLTGEQKSAHNTDLTHLPVSVPLADGPLNTNTLLSFTNSQGTNTHGVGVLFKLTGFARNGVGLQTVSNAIVVASGDTSCGP